jgi:hypothetical protein
MSSVAVSWPASRDSALVSATAFAGVCVLALAAPFEQREPLLRLPWQSISNLEAISLTVLIALSVSVAWSRTLPEWQTPLTAPWLALLAAMTLSAVFAPAARVNALHMTGRVAFGLVVFLVTVNGSGTAARLRRVMTVAVAAGVAVSILAILEYVQVDAVLRWLLLFRASVAFVGSQVRAGGTLQYATIASMYLEIVFAFGLGILLSAFDDKRGAAAAAIFLALLVIAEAVMLTFTRAGLITMAASVGLVSVVRYWQRGMDGGVRLTVLLSALIVILFVTTRSTQAVWLRLTSAGQDSWYRAVFEVPPDLTLATGASNMVPLGVENAGRLAWDSSANPPFYLSYHWVEADSDRVVSFEGVRTPFAAPVVPRTRASMSAEVHAPLQPGRYRLVWDVVQEGQLWFSTEPGATLASSRVTVSGPPLGQPGNTRASALPRPVVRPGRLLLWQAAAKMFIAHPILGVGADNFRLLYGPYAGLTNADPRIHSNNMYIEMLVGGGVPAGLAFLWLVWRAVRCAAGSVRITADRVAEASAIAAAVLAFLLHGMVDSFLSFTPTNVSISITLGLAVASMCGAGTSPDANRV